MGDNEMPKITSMEQALTEREAGREATAHETLQDVAANRRRIASVYGGQLSFHNLLADSHLDYLRGIQTLPDNPFLGH